MYHHRDLFTPHSEFVAVAELVEAIRPKTLDHSSWPPNYKSVYAWRIAQLKKMRATAMHKSGKRVGFVGALEYYSKPEHCVEFIQDWLDTYDPRKTGDAPKWMPFVLFKRQKEFVDFILELIADQESGLVEKSRDVGLTWLCCAVSVWAWLFVPGFAIGWGSRREDLVDELGIIDSIFEKIRLLIRRLPREFLPDGFNEKEHLTFMRCINPANGATIGGESGDNIGRGGRKSIYFKDESAHYERPLKIEAALGDNTNVQLDISSVNGLGNPFHRRREAGEEWRPGTKIEHGKVRVFVVDWRDHPEKTQAWYDARKSKWVAEGAEHIFAQEVDRNYSAALANTIIPLEWIKAAIDAHVKLGIADDGGDAAGFDVADEGGDTNAFARRKNIILKQVEEWGDRDTGVAARRALGFSLMFLGIQVEYDAIGVGSTVKAEYNRLRDERWAEIVAMNLYVDQRDALMAKYPVFNPWNAGAKVQWPYNRLIVGDPESILNRDFFANLKAQAWWSLRLRFQRTFMAVTQGAKYDPDLLISLDSTLPLIRKIEKELAQPTFDKATGTLKMVVEKKPEGTKSPNLADAIVMCYFPAISEFSQPILGQYGNG
jgi:phage terminase large subunit